MDKILSVAEMEDLMRERNVDRDAFWLWAADGMKVSMRLGKFDRLCYEFKAETGPQTQGADMDEVKLLAMVKDMALVMQKFLADAEAEHIVTLINNVTILHGMSETEIRSILFNAVFWWTASRRFNGLCRDPRSGR